MIHISVLFASLLVAQTGDPSAPSHDLKTYEALKAKAGKEGQAQVKLALWCEAHGMNAERVKHLAQAVLSDPKNVLARGLLGLVAVGNRWEPADRAGERMSGDGPLADKRAEYLQRRSRLTVDEINNQQAADLLEKKGDYQAAYTARLKSNRRLAGGHADLGLWCDRNGLKGEATAHFTVAVHLDPSRELSWKHLGYVKRNGRWTSREQLAALEREEREQKQADRYWEPILKKWTGLLGDKRRRPEAEARLASVVDRRAIPSILRLFPIDRPESDQLVRIRLLSNIDDQASSRAIASQAMQTRFSSVRDAAAEVLRQRPPRDYAGELVEKIHGTIQYEVLPPSGPGLSGLLTIDAPRFRMVRKYDVPPAFTLASSFRGYVGYDDNGLPVAAAGKELDYLKAHAADPAAVSAKVREIEFRTAGMLAEATYSAQVQLDNDISVIKQTNDQSHAANASIAPLLESAAGAPASVLGEDEDAWRGWWFDTLGYSYQPSPRPTFTDEVMADYLPYSIRTCFAAGTMVHTRDGSRPIEAIEAGDQVVSQDAATGALSFQPVVFVHRNPPAKTLRLTLSDGEFVVCSIYHRFWRANLGWAQARELKPGDSLRTMSGIVQVNKIVPDSVQPLFNLDVAMSRTFFVGGTTLLVHDNTLPDHRLQPFDALPVIESEQRTH